MAVKTENEISKKESRIQQIAYMLKTENAVSISNLARIFKVAKMTIYRDLEGLENRGLITIINGVAVYKEEQSSTLGQDQKDISYDLPTEIHRHGEEKRRIARKAVDLIEYGDVIYLDSGTTIEYLSRVIPENCNLVIGCHAFYVLVNVQMKKGCSIIFSGGYFHEKTMIYESEESVNLLKRTRINKAFFTAGGVSIDLGVTCSNPFVLSIKHAVMKSSVSKILLVDSSKFNTVKSVHYAEIQNFDVIITDAGIPVTYKTYIEKMGIVLHIV